MSTRSLHLRRAAGVLAFLGTAGSARAQTVAAVAAPEVLPPTAAPDSVVALDTLPRRILPPWLAVNGYLTQAAGASRGGLVSGIPSEGTADYRRAALLARVQPTLADRFVVQLAHRRVGASPLARYQPDVRLDWLFYERSFGTATRLRVGRLPLPSGIYNETRYVGTLLPFYQAPASIYREKEFSNEALDGGLAAHEFELPGGFALETSVFVGRMDYVESSPVPVLSAADGVLGAGAPGAGWTYATARARAYRNEGATVWLTTPVPGLRVGGGAVHAHLRGGLRPAGGAEEARVFYGSVDGTFDRFFVRGEAFDASLESVRAWGGYVQLGARVWGPLSANLQSDGSDVVFRFLPLPPTYEVRPLHFRQNRQHSASVIWAVRPKTQLRLEGHLTRGYNAEEPVDLTAPPRRGRFAILSLSTAF